MESRQFCRILRKLVVVVLVSFIPNSICVVGENNDACSSEWVGLHRACYKFHKEKATWDAAKQQCHLEGGYLVSISSVREKEELKKQLGKEITLMSELHWWIGLIYNRNIGEWLWEDGGEFNDRITPWAPGEPNNGHLNEDCTGIKFDGYLMNMKCDVGYPYICEKNKITMSASSPTPFVRHSTAVLRQTTTSQVDKQTLIDSFTKETPKPVMTITFETENGTISKQTTTSGGITNRSSTTDESKSTTTSTIQNESKNVCYTESLAKSGHNNGKPHSNGDDRFCSRINALNINWPNIKAGTLAKMPCKKGSGFAYWLCGEDPTCWREEPDVKECASAIFQNILEQTMKNGITPTEEETVAVINALVNITSGGERLTTEDIIVTTEVLNNVAKTKPKHKMVAENIVKKAVQIGSNLLSENQTDTWEDMEVDDRILSASFIMEAMETVTMAMAEAIDEPVVIVLKAEHIAMKMLVLDIEAVDTPDVTYDGSDSGIVLSIPTTVLKKYSNGGLTKVVFMAHYKLGIFLEQEVEKEDDGTSNTHVRLASHVVSASLSNTTTEVPEPVTFTMKLTMIMESSFHPLCSFWEFSTVAAGHWSQQGCEVHSYNSTHVTCKCNHLTNFAVLMNVAPVKMAEIHVISLRYITFVGCIISIICLFASWLTFQCFRSIHGERNSIHKHLVCCLLVAEIAFLAGIDKTENEIVCAVVAGLLHYFFLAAFAWMSIEGVHIVMMLVKVFDASSSRMYYYYSIGYGIPLLIVGLTIGLRYDGYGTSDFCWLSMEKFLIWSFAGPVAFILLVNAVILTYAMTTVYKHSEYVFQKQEGVGGNMKAWIQGALALEILLGLTWVFGYFFINEETIIMAYLFTIFNSLQGLFIFLFHCLLNKKVRKEYKKRLHIREKSKTSSMNKTGSLRKPSTSYEMYNSSKA